MKVSIIMGSISDHKVMEPAGQTLKKFGVSFEYKVVSAHRTPLGMVDFALTASTSGTDVIIAGAGGAAHLPGMVAALTTVPVIGVPVKLSSLDGLDSLLSIVQMPKGVPVATVGINRAENAALLAVKMLSIANDDLKQKLKNHMEDQQEAVRKMNEELSEL